MGIVGDNRTKMKVSYVKNVWRCNYCGESGDMRKLYDKTKGVAISGTYREIRDPIQNSICFPIGLPSDPKKGQTLKKASSPLTFFDRLSRMRCYPIRLLLHAASSVWP